MAEKNDNITLDVEKAKLKEDILNDVNRIMGRWIDGLLAWGKAKAKRERREGNENIKLTDFEQACLGADVLVELHEPIRNYIQKSVEMGIREGVKEYEDERPLRKKWAEELDKLKQEYQKKYVEFKQQVDMMDKSKIFSEEEFIKLYGKGKIDELDELRQEMKALIAKLDVI
ncbi:MAG: hypothetical protein IKN12_02350 [Selenomonadaceae bacterium]|nr:hypothetical protein [Selenomonadaceae bacterium]